MPVVRRGETITIHEGRRVVSGQIQRSTQIAESRIAVLAERRATTTQE